jgi:hypothetical protein
MLPRVAVQGMIFSYDTHMAGDSLDHRKKFMSPSHATPAWIIMRRLGVWCSKMMVEGFPRNNGQSVDKLTIEVDKMTAEWGKPVEDFWPGMGGSLSSAPLCVAALESECELNAEVQRTRRNAEKKLKVKILQN